jgi:hypothetical protein
MATKATTIVAPLINIHFRVRFMRPPPPLRLSAPPV